MQHINAIMQNHQVENLSTTDISNAIRGHTNVTEVLISKEVTFSTTDFIAAVGQFDALAVS